jgi:cytidylate kinase
MTFSHDVSKCLAFIGCQINPPPAHEHHSVPRRRLAVTVSRQTGCGTMPIARALSDFLQVHEPSPCGWAVFDKNIVAEMLKEHHLPEQISRFLPEKRVSALRDMMEEVLGLHPPSDTMIQQLSESVMHLAELGHVILVGRAANIITRQMKGVFHVRLTAPLEQRVARVALLTKKSEAEALDFVKMEDHDRRRYVTSYFKADPDDPLRYDLCLNIGRFSFEGAAQVIGQAFLVWAKQLEGAL